MSKPSTHSNSIREVTHRRGDLMGLERHAEFQGLRLGAPHGLEGRGEEGTRLLTEAGPPLVLLDRRRGVLKTRRDR